MHMIRRKDLNSAEVETVRISESPTTVITVNGDVQTNEEATVYVKELDLFLTVKLLEDTPAVLSLGCERGVVGQSARLLIRGSAQAVQLRTNPHRR